MHVYLNESLQPYNTFGLNVYADYFIPVDSAETLKEALSDKSLEGQQFLILGGGSNVLFTAPWAGVVLHNRIRGIETVKETDDHVYIKAGSGEVWHELVLHAIDKGLGGLENLSLIPGSVGASPMQNIGAYGVEIKDTFHELEALDLNDHSIRTFNHAECKFGYRESVFKHELKNKYFILSVTYRLDKVPVLNTSYGAIRQELEKQDITAPDIRDVSNAIIAIRRSKLPDPKELGNSGSFFKNPEVSADVYNALHGKYPSIAVYQLPDGRYKLAAGWMIEQCGWKGKRVGETGSHKDQALVLVNYGHAKGREIYDLALAIRESVYEKFGVLIDPEVNVI